MTLTAILRGAPRDGCREGSHRERRCYGGTDGRGERHHG